MIKIENTDVYGFKAAVRGMRNPLNSWEKSDSAFLPDCAHPGEYTPEIGENDLKLMQALSGAGNDHSKFMRMLIVSADITAPLYWWKEYDTYKVGTVANSCSTMHRIHSKKFTLEDFSCEHLRGIARDDLYGTIGVLNYFRKLYMETMEKKYWYSMIQLLPSSYNQRRTVQLNYQVLKAMDSREGHKLDEWRTFLRWRDRLPYFTEITKGAKT